MKLRLLGLSWMIGTLVAPGVWAQSGTTGVVLSQPIRTTGAELDVRLQAADAAALTQTLGTALGGTVRVEGTLPAPVTLDLQGMPARSALDAVAGALHGTWRPIYTITTGHAPTGALHPVPLGRKVTANLDQVGAHAAFALVARAAGGTLEAPLELDKQVTLVAREMPVEQALDELANQAATAWSVTYVFKPGVAPPPPTPAQHLPPQSRPGYSRPLNTTPGGPGTLPNDRRSFAMPFSGSSRTPAAGTGDDAGKMLALGLTQVMQMPAPQRERAVKDFANQLDLQFRQMLQLPPPRRLEQMSAMRPVYQAALRTYNGLVPAQRREFQPIIDVFSRWIR